MYLPHLCVSFAILRIFDYVLTNDTERTPFTANYISDQVYSSFPLWILTFASFCTGSVTCYTHELHLPISTFGFRSRFTLKHQRTFFTNLSEHFFPHGKSTGFFNCKIENILSKTFYAIFRFFYLRFSIHSFIVLTNFLTRFKNDLFSIEI